MANRKKISELDFAGSVSGDDEFLVVDKSTNVGDDASASGKTSKVTLNTIKNSMFPAGAPIQFWNENSNNIFFNTGNVGIGTDSPGAKLHVSDDDGGLEVLMESSNDFDMDLRLTAGASTPHSYTMSVLHNKDMLRIWPATSGASVGLHMNGAGYVGIGTDSPAEKLHIKGDDARMFIGSDDYNLVSLGRRATTDLDDGYLALYSEGNKKVSIDTKGDTFFNGGNIGIGTVLPTAQLHIEDENANAPGIKISASDLNYEHDLKANGDGILISADSTNYGGAGPDIRFNVSGSEYMRIAKNGNVGIGTETPTANLTIKNPGQHGATGLHIWNSSDGLAGGTGMIGSYTSYGTKLWDATKPDFSYYTGIDMTETGSPPSFRIGYRNRDWAKPGDSNDLVVITSGGRVGIGTGFSPDPTPSVNGMLHLNSHHADGNAELVFNYASNMYPDTSPQEIGINYTDKLHIGSVHNNAPLVTMTLNSNGCVGIGDTNPSGHSLVIDSKQNACIFAKVTGTGNYKKYFLRGFQGDTQLVQIGADEANNGEIIIRNKDGVVTSSILNGNILTEGSITTQDFQVNGDFAYSGTMYNIGTDVSDVDNVHETNMRGIETLNKIHVCDYTINGKTIVGCVSQDIKNALPSAVSEIKKEVEVCPSKGNIIHGEGDSKLIVRANVTKNDFEKQSWPETYQFEQTHDAETEDVTKLAVSQDQLIATLIKSVQELNGKVNRLTAEVRKNK